MASRLSIGDSLVENHSNKPLSHTLRVARHPLENKVSVSIRKLCDARNERISVEVTMERLIVIGASVRVSNVSSLEG